jgi:hypothetical protein
MGVFRILDLVYLLLGQTPPFGLFGLVQIKHWSWVQLACETAGQNIQTHTYIYKILLSCKVQNDKVA